MNPASAISPFTFHASRVTHHPSRITHPLRRRDSAASHASRMPFVATLLLALPAASAQPTNQTYPIDLPTALRLANAQNLDIQIARERLKEAKANHQSAMEQFFPWISPAAAYRRHEGRIQAVDGAIFDADK